MSRRIVLSEVTAWITEVALTHPDDLVQHLARRLNTRRRLVRALLRNLVAAQWLQRRGPKHLPHFQPGALRQVIKRYALADLQEDWPWSHDFAPCFDLPDNVARMAQHAFTELLNNAIEHSGGTSVTVSLRQTPVQLQMLISDDGRGIFDTIGQTFQILDPALAMMELSKGKLSSQPDRHTGRGLFFTAKLADVIDVHANNAAFQQREWERDQWHAGRPACPQGTAVYVAIRMDTERTLDSVMRSHSLDGQSYGFERTVVPLQLLVARQQGLASRAQARRVAHRLPQFQRVELDFAGLPEVGHPFADELLRVFHHQHPEVDLVPLNMAPSVAAMVGSVMAGAA